MRRARFAVVVAALGAMACTDAPGPTEPSLTPALSRGAGPDRLAELFATHSPGIMAMAGTVFADHDEDRGKLVFGVMNENAAFGVQRSLEARGIAPADHEVRVTQPIRQVATLRDRWRPTRGGLQIHFSQWVCTLGFNVDHAGGRSFITNSHCTNQQGGTEGTTYAQPSRSIDPTVVATEVDDPAYFTGNGCSVGKKCRYSDASRALYSSDVASDRGIIAKTSGANNGSLEVTGAFTVTGQDNSSTRFSGTVSKVGRTTGWTQGTVVATCATVNVSGSNIQQLCQTLVENESAVIVGGGDSGSPVFAASGDNATLIGILWGGSSDNKLFVFSPLKNIQDELGSVTATSDGSGGGGGGGEPGPCVPKGPHGKNCK